MISKAFFVFFLVFCLSDFSHGQKDKKFFRADYTYIEVSQAFYKIHTIPKNLADAKRICALEGASLFYPENDDETNAVIALWKETQWTIPTVSVTDNEDLKNNDNVCRLLNKEGTKTDGQCHNKYHYICKKSLKTLDWDHNCNMSDFGYTYNEDLGKCYKFHKTPLTWTDAYFVCSAEQSHLAVITNRAEANYLAKLTESAPRQKVKGNYYRGIYHLGFHNKFNEGWQTVKVEHKNKPIFRTDYTYIEASQAFYKMHTTPKNLADAKRVCALEGASLYYPEDTVEVKAVTEFWEKIQPSIPKVYVGISATIAKGVFRTTDNRPVWEVYNNWQTGEPNDCLDVEDCVTITNYGLYYDCRCDQLCEFICKKSLQSLEWDHNCNIPNLGNPLNDTEAWWGNYLPEADDSDQCGSMFYSGLLTYVSCDTKSFFICEHEGHSDKLSEEH